MSKSVIYKDNFRSVTVKVGKSDLEEAEPSSGGGGDGSEGMMVVKMMMMIDDVELISGIHIASRMFVNFL
jgi:hypothetical protein